jgi:Bromodomain
MDEDEQDKFTYAMKFRRMIAEEKLSNLYPSIVTCINTDVPELQVNMDINRKEEDEDNYEDALYVPFDDVYYTLDYDLELLENLDLIELPSSYQDVVAETKPQQSTKESEPQSLKYMLQIISMKADPHQLKEIKKLIVESRPSKSRWASDERIGQEQLYEPLEKALNGLKNYTDHSHPFLKPVLKRDAPQYHYVIKNPMDLGTITRKLKNLQYTSKQEFVADLDLIWSNCLLFNSEPSSIYRVHAYKMKDRAQQLCKKVPDVKIRNAADVSDSEDDEKSVDMGNNMTRSVSMAFDFAESSQGAVNPAIAELQTINSPTASYNDTQPSAKGDDEDDANDEQQQFQQQFMKDKDMNVRMWKTKTFLQRVKILKDRAEQLKRPFAERQSLRRFDAGVQYYLDQEKMYYKRSKLRVSAINEMNEDALDVLNSFHLPELHLVSSVPTPPIKTHQSGDLAIFFADEDDNAPFIPPAPNPSMSEYQQFKSNFQSEINQGISTNSRRA